MKLKKIALGCAAMALSVMMSTSAFAAVTAEYAKDDAAGTVTLSNLAGVTGEYTVLIIDVTGEDGAADYSKETDVAQGDIMYINQGADLTDAMGLKNGLEEGHTYVLKVGGTDIAVDGIYRAEFTVGDEGNAILLGDASQDGTVDTTDAGYIIQKYLDARTLEGDALKAADASGDGSVDTTDAGYVIQDYLDARELNPAK